jgi:hypothetical protein
MRYLSVLLLFLALAALAEVTTFAPADLRGVVAGGGTARLVEYQGKEVLEANLAAQKGAARFGEAKLFDKAPGKYRAVFRLSAQNPPVGRFGDLEIAILHGDTVLAARPLDLSLLPADGSVQEIPLAFVLDKAAAGNLAPVQLLVRWTSRGDLALLRHHGLTLERVSGGAAITRLRVEKLIYKPGQPGVARAQVCNFGTTPATGTVTLALTTGLADRTVLAPVPFTLAPGVETTLALPFTAPGEWGVRAEATLAAGGVTDTATDCFSVTNSYFAVGIGYPAGPITVVGRDHSSLPEQMRAAYANMLEIFFWAPCDWAKLTSDREEWWGGQCSYHETETGLKSLIGACHARGIAVAGYCSQNAAGPEGWEVARRHPEWFYPNPDGSINGGYDVFHFDHWNNPAWRAEQEAKKAESLPWYALNVDLRQMAPLDYGIDQIIASWKRYGWDAMRYDGHYRIPGNDEMSARNMRRLKERVAAEAPGLLLGYNYGLAPEYSAGSEHEIRETMSGGGLYMQEGIRSLRYMKERYTSWKHYASNELRIAKALQAQGGYYHCIWDLSGKLGGEKDPAAPERGLYVFLYGLIAGGHPYYGTHQALPGCANWGAFLTRWSGMLWDRRLKLLPKPETQFTVIGQKLEWQPFVQERQESTTRKYVVLHLVTPPESDSIDNTPPAPPKPKTATAEPADPDAPEEIEDAPAEAAAPPPSWSRDVTVRYRPAPGTTVTRAVLVRPEATPDAVTLEPARDGDGLKYTVPHPRYWSMVVLEVAGTFPAPAPLPDYAEPPDPAKCAITTGPPLAFHNDPLKGNLPVPTDGVEYVLLNRGSCNIGNNPMPDPDSDLSVVQWRETQHASDKIGMWWASYLEAGKYRCSIRLKWTDVKAEPTPQSFRMTMIGHEGVKVDGPLYVTPGYPNPPAGAKFLGEKGKYQYYDLGVIEFKKVKYITFDGYANTAKAGDNALYADRIKIETVERYDDAKLAEWNPVEKPADLRAPQGAAPKKVLQVKGLFWQLYGLEKATACDGVYNLFSTDYPALYGYDTVVLADYDFYGTDYATRKRLRDFVADGGRLVVLGGPKTLGYGRMAHTYLEELLPVTLKADHEVVKCEPPLTLGPAAGKAYPGDPTLFWLHDVTPRPGATPLAYAGTHPIAFTRPYGRGRVIVFAGTILGEGEKAFWESAAWTGLLKRMCVE